MRPITHCSWCQQWQVPPQTFLISPDLRNWSCSERSSVPGVNQSSLLACRHSGNVWKECLIPRPHPLMWKSSLVNQVKFLGLVHAFTTSNVRNLLRQTHSKRYGYLSKEIFGNRPKKFDSFLLGGVCGLGTRLREPRGIGSQSASVPVENAWAFHVCCTWN